MHASYCALIAIHVNRFHRCRVTDDLLAMSRPSTEIIEKYKIIDQFKRYISFFYFFRIFWELFFMSGFVDVKVMACVSLFAFQEMA